MCKSVSVSVLQTLVLALTLSVAAHAHADDRSEARAHYQAGLKYYTGGDYRGAIREFSAAQQLAPADLNNYNLALCYDKLGDAEPAIQYYRAFLDKQPGSDKRAEIDASINRLESALRSASSKKADDARRADEAKRAEEAAPADEARAPGPIGPAPGPAAPSPSIGPSPAPPATDERKPRKGPAIAGSIGTPSTATPVPTGDSQLDRVNSINVDEVRDQRFGGAGIADGRGGPAVAAGPTQPGQPAPSANPPSAPASEPIATPTDQPKKEGPVYKKWWFWAVMGVSAVVVYELATSSSERRDRNFSVAVPDTARPGGLTLRW